MDIVVQRAAEDFSRAHEDGERTVRWAPSVVVELVDILGSGTVSFISRDTGPLVIDNVA